MYVYTVKTMNEGHQMETQHMVFIDKWLLFGGFIDFLLNFIKEDLLKCDFYLQGGLFWRWPLTQI